MGTALIHLGIVTSSLALLIVLPFLPISFLLFRGKQWPKILFSAMVLGCSLQAIVGILWSHLAGNRPTVEIAVLAAVWVGLLAWSMSQAGRHKIVVWDPDDNPIHTGLVIILGVAFVLRSIHPVEVAYLGQSDAYTHLNYIRNLIDLGYLVNPMYPPGYHWILALPSLLFSIDPYYTARFAGAFFGTGMVLGIYVLLDQCVNRRAALFGSFCAAAFPGMNLLMKTGVGVFANQFGLFLLPAVFMFYILAIASRNWKTNNSLLLIISLCGMAAAVPMMLIHVLLVVCLERSVMLVRHPKQWFGKTMLVTLLVIPAVCLFIFHMSQVGGKHRFETAEMMMGYGAKKTTIIKNIAEKVETKVLTSRPQSEKIVKHITQSPYFKLFTDYVSMKRHGFGDFKLDTLAVSLVVLFFILLMIGIVREGTSYIVVGFWGLLTSVQTGTGLLQFSAYQREGWSLLVATCCLSGIIAASIYRLGERSYLFRGGVLAVIVISVAWSILHPPMHFPIRSSGEDELVRTIRFLREHQADSTEECNEKDKVLCSITDLLDNSLSITLVTRRYVGWGNQGEIARNVISQDSDMSVLIVDKKMKNDIFQPDRQYVALVDEEKRISGQQLISAFAMVTPSMVEATLRSRNQLFRINNMILEQIESLSKSQWKVDHIAVSNTLSAFVVTPRNSG